MKHMGTGSRNSAVATAALGVLGFVLLAGCAEQPPTAEPTHLEITIRADGNTISDQFILDCNGTKALDSSTLSEAAEACKLIAEKPEIIVQQQSPQAICTEIFGGPERAEITGELAGKSVQSTYSKHNGCAIDRWSRAELLLGQ